MQKIFGEFEMKIARGFRGFYLTLGIIEHK